MKLSDFDYHLPKGYIADYPANPRESAKLLHVKADGTRADLHVADIPNLLFPGDVLVVNNTRVVPARLVGMLNGKSFELTLHTFSGQNQCWALTKPLRVVEVGDYFTLPNAQALVVEKHPTYGLKLQFHEGENLFVYLEKNGQMPLPPYIKRDKADAHDKENYQTIFAADKGSVAAPTAGLHITENLLHLIQAKGVEVVPITLHVGIGTFLPVKVENILEHTMHAEFGRLTQTQADAINARREGGGRVVAVGTTATRLLETATDTNGRVQAFEGSTDLFITPGYKFKAVDRLMTNFHLPKSTLLMLVSAFAGVETIRNAYTHAIEKHYRFFSYGDACLLEPKKN